VIALRKNQESTKALNPYRGVAEHNENFSRPNYKQAANGYLRIATEDASPLRELLLSWLKNWKTASIGFKSLMAYTYIINPTVQIHTPNDLQDWGASFAGYDARGVDPASLALNVSGNQWVRDVAIASRMLSTRLIG